MALMIFDLDTRPDYTAIARAKGLSPDDLPSIKLAIDDERPTLGFHEVVGIGYLVVAPGEGRYDIAEIRADHIGGASRASCVPFYKIGVTRRGQLANRFCQHERAKYGSFRWQDGRYV